MKAIVVDDERLMLRGFARHSEGIEGLELVGQFDSALEALEYAESNPVDIAFLDVRMPKIDGIELARRLRAHRSDMLIVFISAYSEFVTDSNSVGADYYIVKPYKRETLEMVMERMRLLSDRQEKDISVKLFGGFAVFKRGERISLSGKAKEILAIVVARRGIEVSNEEIYSTIWENRPYSNENMKVYYNALQRLKKALDAAGVRDILVSTTRGQMANTQIFDCDYYQWLDGEGEFHDIKEEDFLPEYSWGIDYFYPGR